MNRQAMAQRVAHDKVAQMRKESFLNLKRLFHKLLSKLPSSITVLLQGADEDQISKEIKRLQKDKDFMDIVERAPKKSSLKRLWGYFNFELKRAFNFSKSVFVAIVIFATIMAAAGGLTYFFLGPNQMAMFVVGMLVAPSLSFDLPGLPSERKQRNNAREIAKNRLMNAR